MTTTIGEQIDAAVRTAAKEQAERTEQALRAFIRELPRRKRTSVVIVQHHLGGEIAYSTRPFSFKDWRFHLRALRDLHRHGLLR